MLQRIQSLFLLLASGSAGALFVMPILTSADAIQASVYMQDRIFDATDHIALMITFGLSGLLALFSIFLFRNRKAQMRLTFVSIIFMLAGIGFGIGIISQDSMIDSADSLTVGVGIALPLLAILLLGLAYRFVQKDDQLVKSMDRLR